MVLTSRYQAIASLKACPITYAHPSDAIALIGIGPAIIKFLMKKLAAYCEENGLDMPNEGKPNSRILNKFNCLSSLLF